MKIRVFIVLLPALLFLAGRVSAQLEYSAFTATGSAYSVTGTSDYQCLGINPANLGLEGDGYTWHFSISEFASSVYAEPLSKEQLRKDLFGGNAEEFPDFNENPQMHFEAIEKFTRSRLLGRAAVNLFGISYQDEKLGGIAFTVRTRLHWNSQLNNQAARFLFLGYHDTTYFDIMQDEDGYYGKARDPKRASLLYHPSNLEHLLYNEYILGYGRKILEKENFSWYGGFALKYIQGYGMVYMDIESDNDFEGYMSLSPFYDVDYGDNDTPSRLTGDGLKTAGAGLGFDLGMSFRIYEKLQIGLAINDIGNVNWDANVYEGENPDIDEIRSEGLNSYNIFSEAGDFIGEHSNVGEWDGLPEIDISLPTNLRAGASYRFNEQWEMGTDFYVPLKKEVPGAYKEAIFALGGRYDPLEWLQLSAGITTGGQYEWTMPAGIVIRPLSNPYTLWEIGFATRDLASLFKQDNATLSYCMGLLRFGIKHRQEEVLLPE